MNLELKHFTHVDFIVALVAMAWAIASQDVEQLGELVNHKAAFAFAAVAFVRWLNDVRKDKRRDG